MEGSKRISTSYGARRKIAVTLPYSPTSGTPYMYDGRDVERGEGQNEGLNILNPAIGEK